MSGRIRAFLGDLWSLTKPYFVSEERWSAWGFLIILVVLSLGQVYMLVLLNQWYNGFYNTFLDKNEAEFWRLILQFSIYALIYISLYTYYVYLMQALGIRWMVTFARRRNGRSMIDKLANEIMDAANGQGGAVRRREEGFKMAEANKAFSHYRF